eukprot:5439312-Amphidinium_carterae.1
MTTFNLQLFRLMSIFGGLLNPQGATTIFAILTNFVLSSPLKGYAPLIVKPFQVQNCKACAEIATTINDQGLKDVAPPKAP